MRRPSPVSICAGFCVAMLLTVAPAAARDMRGELIATGALALDTNERCEREASDVIGCTSLAVYPTLEISGELRWLDWLGVGAFVGLSRLGSNDAEVRDGVRVSGADDRLLRAAGELRLHPLALLSGAWVGASFGVAKRYGSAEQNGALLGGSLGVDWTLFERLVLGVGARVEHLAIGGSEVLGRGLTVGQSRYGAGVRTWIGARVGVAF